MAHFRRMAIRLAILGATLASLGGAQDQPAALFEEGMASWYGSSFDGLRSASGEIFDSAQLTAAHRTLPFGTMVRVRRLDSNSSIVVRITDRGPFVDSRIIDLSYAAARQLGLTDPGVVRVALEVLGDLPAPPVSLSPLTVQVGTYRNLDNARRMRDRMQARFGAVTLRQNGEFWCVLVGSAATQADADHLVEAVRQSDSALQSVLVVKL